MSMKNRVPTPAESRILDTIGRSSIAKPSGEKVRWVKPKNLHITLVPPWYEENIKQIKEVLGSIRDTFGPFEIIFERITYGPDPRRPRLIWAEGEASLEIRNLKLEIERALNQKPEERPFKLHLTIARFRPETFSSFPIKKLDEKVFWRDEVKSFVIMESHLSPEGADYEVLEEIRLEKNQ
jgi:2'-5' RNA ligase